MIIIMIIIIINRNNSKGTFVWVGYLAKGNLETKKTGGGQGYDWAAQETEGSR